LDLADKNARMALHHKKKITFVLKNIPKARAIYGTNIKIYNIILNK